MERVDQKQVRYVTRSALLPCAAIVIAGLLPGASAAQDNASEQRYLTLLGIHSATVAPQGLFFASASQSFQLDGDLAEEDTAATLGFGLGDANTGLGFQFAASANSETDNFDSFGYFGVKVAGRLQSAAAPTYLGLAVDRIGGWGEAEDVDPATSVMLTRFTTIQTDRNTTPVIMTIGVGSDVQDDATEPGVFLGAGLGMSRNLSASAAWNGEFIEVGTAFKFDAVENLAMTVSISDAFNHEDRQQLSIGLSWFYDAR